MRELDDNLRVAFNCHRCPSLALGHLEPEDESRELGLIIRSVANEIMEDMYDLSRLVPEDTSHSRGAWVPFGGPVEIVLDGMSN